MFGFIDTKRRTIPSRQLSSASSVQCAQMQFKSFLRILDVIWWDVDAYEVAPEIACSNCSCPTSHKRVKHQFGIRAADNPFNQSNRIGRWMWIVSLLSKRPYITMPVRTLWQLEFRFANQVDDFISGQKVSLIKIDAAIALPNDDLTHRKTWNNVLPVLQ